MSAVRLVDHATLIRGITFKPVDKCDPGDEGAVVCMRTKNVQATLDASDLIAVPSRLVKNPEKMLSTGDILVSSANSWNLVGKCCQVPKLQYPSTAGGFISILRPKTKKLESSYLYRWFSWGEIQRKLRSFANQTTNISNLDHKKTLELQIPLPPLAEQKRIANILDAADALRAKRREALAQLDTLIQSTFLDMFGDPVTNSNIPSAIMTELVIKFIDYRGKSPEKSKRGVPLITAKIVKEKEVKEPNEFIPANSYDAWMRRGIPNPGDVVITTEAPMGEVALVPDYKAAFAQRLLVLQPDETKVKSIYLMWALTMPFVIRQLRQRSTGSTVTGIRSREFKKVTIPIPSMDLQRRFAAIAESVELQRASQRAHLAELDTLFASLQSRAFRGEL